MWGNSSKQLIKGSIKLMSLLIVEGAFHVWAFFCYWDALIQLISKWLISWVDEQVQFFFVYNNNNKYGKKKE